MIKLDIDDYCHDCDAFKPTTIEKQESTLNGYITHTVVVCKERRRCANMMRYLERKLKYDAEQNHRLA